MTDVRVAWLERQREVAQAAAEMVARERAKRPHLQRAAKPAKRGVWMGAETAVYRCSLPAAAMGTARDAYICPVRDADGHGMEIDVVVER